jgi:hypothetical protein
MTNNDPRPSTPGWGGIAPPLRERLRIAATIVERDARRDGRNVSVTFVKPDATPEENEAALVADDERHKRECDELAAWMRRHPNG